MLQAQWCGLLSGYASVDGQRRIKSQPQSARFNEAGKEERPSYIRIASLEGRFLHHGGVWNVRIREVGDKTQDQISDGWENEKQADWRTRRGYLTTYVSSQKFPVSDVGWYVVRLAG